jgi:hypothetical protein
VRVQAVAVRHRRFVQHRGAEEAQPLPTQLLL